MDEPFAALDVTRRAKMQHALLDVWPDCGASVLFATHHIDEYHSASSEQAAVPRGEAA
jgi:NitT/TauT family transport system ATP-binding protein